MSDEQPAHVVVYAAYGSDFELTYEKGEVGLTLPLSKKELKYLRASINTALPKGKSK